MRIIRLIHLDNKKTNIYCLLLMELLPEMSTIFILNSIVAHLL